MKRIAKKLKLDAEKLRKLTFVVGDDLRRVNGGRSAVDDCSDGPTCACSASCGWC